MAFPPHALIMVPMGLIDPFQSSRLQYSGSTKITKPLTDILLSDSSCLTTEILNEMHDIKKMCLKTKDIEFKSLAMSAITT